MAKVFFLVALLVLGAQGWCSEVTQEKDKGDWWLVEGEETIPWKKQFDAAAKKDRLHEEMKKIGIFSTRGPIFFRNEGKDTVRALFYIGFVGRYEVELKLVPKLRVAQSYFRDGAKGERFEDFRPMYDAFIEDLLKLHGELTDKAEDGDAKSGKEKESKPGKEKPPKEER